MAVLASLSVDILHALKNGNCYNETAMSERKNVLSRIYIAFVDFTTAIDQRTDEPVSCVFSAFGDCGVDRSGAGRDAFSAIKLDIFSSDAMINFS